MNLKREMGIWILNTGNCTEKFQNFLSAIKRAFGIIKMREDGVCEDCEGTGEVSCDEAVYQGEPHTASVGTRKCICQLNNEDNE